MSKTRGSRGSGESKRALRAAASGQWENISTGKKSKSNFAVISGEVRLECVPTPEAVREHAAHNRAVEAFRGKSIVRLVKE